MYKEIYIDYILLTLHNNQQTEYRTTNGGNPHQQTHCWQHIHTTTNGSIDSIRNITHTLQTTHRRRSKFHAHKWNILVLSMDALQHHQQL